MSRLDQSRQVLESYRAEREFRDQLGLIRDFFAKGPNYDRRLLMALQASVQKLIDEVAETRDLKDSVAKGFELMSAKIDDLKTQLGSIVPGQPIDAENAAAIQKAADDLEQTNEALKTAVPNQDPAPPPPTAEELAAAGITTPPTHDQAGNPLETQAPAEEPKP
jgi:hypothetical protein